MASSGHSPSFFTLEAHLFWKLGVKCNLTGFAEIDTEIVLFFVFGTASHAGSSEDDFGGSNTDFHVCAGIESLQASHFSDAAKTSSLLGLSGLCVAQCAAFSILICVGAENKLTHTSLFYGTKCNVLRFVLLDSFIKVKYTGSTYSKLMTVKHTNSIQLTDFKMI